MGRFLHPHLVRGIVCTSMGSFSISRGIVDAPDHVGESFGWKRLEQDQADANPQPAVAPSDSTGIGGSRSSTPR